MGSPRLGIGGTRYVRYPHVLVLGRPASCGIRTGPVRIHSRECSRITPEYRQPARPLRSAHEVTPRVAGVGRSAIAPGGRTACTPRPVHDLRYAEIDRDARQHDRIRAGHMVQPPDEGEHRVQSPLGRTVEVIPQTNGQPACRGTRQRPAKRPVRRGSSARSTSSIGHSIAVPLTSPSPCRRDRPPRRGALPPPVSGGRVCSLRRVPCSRGFPRATGAGRWGAAPAPAEACPSRRGTAAV